jgi:hypothetical protein
MPIVTGGDSTTSTSVPRAKRSIGRLVATKLRKFR